MSTAKKAIIFLIIIAAVGSFIAYNMINANRLEAASGVSRNALPVNWTYPHRQTIVSQVSARGTVELVDRHLIFPETSAQVVNVHVSVGDVVNIGDLLVTYDDGVLDSLNDSLAQARLALRQAELGLAAARIGPAETELLSADNQIEQARSNINSINNQLDQIDLQISQIQTQIRTAKDNANRIQGLFDNGVATRLELDNSFNAVRQLEDQLAITQGQRDATAAGLPLAQEGERLALAQRTAIQNRNVQPGAQNQAAIQQVTIEQARLNIAQIERNISEFEQHERATVGGTVLSVLVSEGEFSAMGRPLMEIADVSSDNLVVIVYVPENDAGNIALNQEVEISGGALGTHTYPGRISLIHPIAAPRQIGNAVETVLTVEISVENTNRLTAGINVDADITTGINENTLVVPLMATLSAGGGVNFVYVIDEDSTLRRRDIVLGEFSNMYIEAFGIEDRDRVVSNPTHSMYDGMQVRPLGIPGTIGATHDY